MRDVEPDPGRLILASDCDWLNGQLEALYEHDDRRRTTARREPVPSPAARFHLSRSRHGIVWRVRADQPAWLVRRLSQLAAREPRLHGPDADWSPPERVAAIRTALEEHAPIQEDRSGPVYRQAASADSLRSIERLARGSERVDPADSTVIREIAEEFPALAPTIALRGPLVVSRDAGRVASVCYRASGAAHRLAEPGIDTLPAFRRRHHASRALAGWWTVVREAGGIPLYATNWDNAASLGVARSLGLESFADSWRWI